MKIIHLFKRLTLWNKIAVIVAIAAIVGVSALVVLLLFTSSPVAVILYSPDVDIDKLATALATQLSKPISSEAGWLNPDNLSTTGHPPGCVLLLIDASASMKSHPVSKEVFTFAEGRKRHDLVGIAAFSKTTVEVVPFGNYTQERFRSIFEDLRFEGKFYDIEKDVTVSMLALSEISDGVKQLVVFTDSLQDIPSERTLPEEQGIQLEVVRFSSNGIIK